MLSVDDEVLSSANAEQLQVARSTHSVVGASRSDILPWDYAFLQRSRRIGSEPERFEKAAPEFLGWDMHRRAGIEHGGTEIRTVSATCLTSA